MINRTYIKDLKNEIGKEVTIAGWVDVRRDQGKMVFMDMRDMTGRVQTVVLPNHKEAIDAVKEVRTEWVLKIKGLVNKRPEKNIKEGVVNGDIELEILDIEILANRT
jgi:aspartyl-tRNA synthetase